MKTKNLKINFRYLCGNIVCLSVDSTNGKSVHNDINNEEAIIIFNSLVGEKENCQTVKSLLEENEELKQELEDKEDYIVKLQATKDRLDRYDYERTIQQQEFIKYLESCIKELENESPNKLQNVLNLGISDITKEILQKYKKILGGE